MYIEKGGNMIAANFRSFLIFSLAVLALVCGCQGFRAKIPMESKSVDPGTSVTRGEARFQLLGTPISIGKPLPPVNLVDAVTMKDVDLSKEKGAVLFLSIVPSVDTVVCEEQTHSLGEEGEKLPGEIRRIAISRDTPFAQKRFAKEAKLTHLQYLSDYREGEFGRSTGLLTEKTMLLARSVLLVDKRGIVRYIQVVPEITRLPDMERAFQKAVELNREN
jgi:thioredoxin-dependent peroxiredoxin